MKALKGIMIYTGLVIMAIILIGALLVGFLFLSKKSTLFGYYFRNVSFEEASHFSLDLAEDSVETVKVTLSAENYNLVVRVDADKTNLNVSSSSQYFGFLKASKDVKTGKNKPVTTPNLVLVSKNLDEDSKTLSLSFKLQEQEGLLSFKNQNNLYIDLPYYSSGSTTVKYDLDLTTGNKNIKFVTDTVKVHKKEKVVPLNATSMKLTTNKGDVTVSGIGSEIGADLKTLSMNNLTISTNGGTFDFTSYEKVGVGSLLKLNSQKANYKFNELSANGVEVIGTNVKFEAKNVKCGEKGFLYRADTGALNIKTLESYEKTLKADSDPVTPEYEYKIYENTIFTESSDVQLGTVYGKLGVKNTYGNVKITTLVHQASITSKNGNVNIDKSGEDPSGTKSEKSSLIIYTTFGDINVGSYYQDGVFYSKKGSITVNSKVDKPDRGDRYYYTDITSKDGKITMTTDGNPFRIVCIGDANVQLTVNKMKDEVKVKGEAEGESGLLPGGFKEKIPYYISTNNGKIDIKLPIQSYMIFVKGSKVSGEIGAKSNFSAKGTQINSKRENQPEVSVEGKKIVLSSII